MGIHRLIKIKAGKCQKNSEQFFEKNELIKMTWKDEIKKKEYLEKVYEFAYQNFEVDSKEFLSLLLDVMEKNYYNDAIREARSFMQEFERAYGNIKNILERIENKN